MNHEFQNVPTYQHGYRVHMLIDNEMDAIIVGGDNCDDAQENAILKAESMGCMIGDISKIECIL